MSVTPRRAFRAVGTGIALWLFAELLLSFTPISRWSEFAARSWLPSLLQEDVDLLWRMKPNANVTIENFHIRTNDKGLRCLKECFSWNRLTSENTFRVLCLGGGITTGWKVDDAFTWPAMMQKELNARHPVKPFRVVNGGVVGYSSTQGLIWLKRDLLDLHPDVLCVCFGYNDHSLTRDKTVLEQIKEMKNIRNRARRLLEKSNLYKLLLRLSMRFERKDFSNLKYTKRRTPLPEFRRNLEEFYQIAVRNNFSLVFINEKTTRPEESHREYYAAMHKIAEIHGILYVDIARKFENLVQRKTPSHTTLKENVKRKHTKPYKKIGRKGINFKLKTMTADERYSEYFQDDCHANTKGNQLIARWIVKAMLKANTGNIRDNIRD